MMPWEETWERTECGDDYCNRVLNGEPTEVFLGAGPRLQLASAAPEMARALLLAVTALGDSNFSEYEAVVKAARAALQKAGVR